MNLAIRLAIVASLALNVVLGSLYTIERQKSQAVESQGDSALQSSVLTRKSPPPDVGDLAAYYQKLKALDMNEEQRRQLVLVQLKRKNFPLPTNAKFWEIPKTAESPTAAALVRDSLVAMFGDGAWGDPTFTEFFRPLQPQLPFLSAQKQVALEQLFIAAREDAQKKGAPDLDWAQQRRMAEESAANLEQSVQKILDAKEYAEYELRMSQLAQSLRLMRLDLSETQYRDLYAAVRQNAQLQGAVTHTLIEPRPSSAFYDSKVAAVLGPKQYVKFMAQCDPLYSMMNSLTRTQNVAPEAVKVAYADLIAAQATIAKLQANKDPGLSAALAARHQKLTAALGAPATMMVEGMLGGASAGPGPMRASLFGAR